MVHLAITSCPFACVVGLACRCLPTVMGRTWAGGWSWCMVLFSNSAVCAIGERIDCLLRQCPCCRCASFTAGVQIALQGDWYMRLCLILADACRSASEPTAYRCRHCLCSCSWHGIAATHTHLWHTRWRGNTAYYMEQTPPLPCTTSAQSKKILMILFPLPTIFGQPCVLCYRTSMVRTRRRAHGASFMSDRQAQPSGTRAPCQCMATADDAAHAMGMCTPAQHHLSTISAGVFSPALRAGTAPLSGPATLVYSAAKLVSGSARLEDLVGARVVGGRSKEAHKHCEADEHRHNDDGQLAEPLHSTHNVVMECEESMHC